MCKYEAVKYLLICCLFNDADSILGYLVSSARMIIEQGMWGHTEESGRGVLDVCMNICTTYWRELQSTSGGAVNQ